VARLHWSRYTRRLPVGPWPAQLLGRAGPAFPVRAEPSPPMSEPMSPDALRRIADLVEPSLRQCGVELFDAQWDRGTLRLVIEKPGGVSLDDCERVSTVVGAVLDAYDPIEGSYQLEVSSPGAERPLRDLADWRRQVGRRVNVRLRGDGHETVVEGRLVAVGEETAEVEVRDRRTTRRLVVRLADVVAARLAVEI
jgi:ribosome maturation factor RimP